MEAEYWESDFGNMAGFWNRLSVQMDNREKWIVSSQWSFFFLIYLTLFAIINICHYPL